MAVALIRQDAVGSADKSQLVKVQARVLTNGETIFNVFGDIQLLSLYSECYTPNGAGATTLQYSTTTALGQTQTLGNSSTTLANVIAGTVVMLAATASLAENMLIATNGVLVNTASRGVRIPPGVIKTVITNGPSTGTWAHYLKYEPLEVGAYVTAA
jgi:hypothetical protein